MTTSGERLVAKRRRPAALSSPTRSGDLERLLQAAERLAVETKLDKAFTTNALAECGIMSVGSIHNHIGSRDQIVAILIRRQADRLVARLPPMTPFDKIQVLRGHADAVLEVIRSSPLLFAVLDAEECARRTLSVVGLRSALELSLLQAFSQPGAPRWTPLELIAGQLSGIMLAMAADAVKRQVPVQIASRNMQQIGVSLLDSCRWS